jgi:hypothetical protein
MPRRRIASRTTVRGRNADPDPAKREYGEPIYTWAFQSSQPRGGFIVTYETRLEEDGTLRCNCMGWVFQRKDKDTGLPKPRSCKHTDQVSSEVDGLMRRFRNGETLEVLNQEVVARITQGPRAPATPTAPAVPPENTNSRARFGRVIEV